jgi:hypothetical protein
MRKNYNFISQEDTDESNIENSTRFSASNDDKECNVFPTINDDIKINEICLKSKDNEDEWQRQVFNYKLSEIVLYLIGLATTLASLAFSVWLLFFSEYRHINDYFDKLKNALSLNKYTSSMSLYYFILELIATFLDVMKFFLLLKILLIFSSNSKKQSTKRGLSRDEDGGGGGGDDTSQTAGDYLIVVDEENRRTQTLNKLSQRIQCRVELKHLFKHFIRIEVLINLYFLLFVIAPKILGSVYIELFLNPLLNTQNFNNKTLLTLNELNYNLTADLNQTIYNIQPSLVNSYECDSDLDANSSECFYSLAFYYLRSISIIWFATALLKFLVQCVLLFNFFHLLINRLTRKKRIEEERMHENYEKARQNILHTKIRAKIEETEQRLAENIEHIDFNLDLSKYSFPKRKSQTRQVSPPPVPMHINGSTSISMYDLTDHDKSDLNEDEKNAIEAIEYVNDINDDGFKSYNSNSNISAPKFDTFKKSTFK